MDKTINKRFLIGFLTTFVLVVILISFYLQHEYQKVKESKFEDLKNLSSIKLEALLNYINEEKYKLNQLINSEFFKTNFSEFLSAKKSINEINKFLFDVKSLKHLEDIVFINPEGKILFSFNVLDNIIDTITTNLFSEVTPSKVLIDIYKIRKSDIVYIFQFPFYENTKSGEKLLGFIRFQFDALNTLIPRIEFIDPGSSKEILLLKYEGNKLIFLSYLKGMPIKPLNLSQELNEFDCFKKKLDENSICNFEGLDYAGNPVLAVVHKIPNTNWLLMTKQNKSEINDSYRNQVIPVTIFILGSFLLVGFSYLIIHNTYQKIQFKKELELKKSKHSLEKELEMISTQISDAVFVLNSKGEIIKASKSVEKMYGYKVEEILGKTVDIICMNDEASQLQESFKIIQQSENYIYESTHRKKDGSFIDVEVNSRSFKINGDSFIVGSVRDITERKRTLEEIQRKLEVEKFLTEIASEMINLNLENYEENFLSILNRLGGILKVDRIRFFLKQPQTNLFDCKFEWCSLGIPTYKERLQYMNLSEEFPFFYKIINKGLSFKCSDIQMLPEEAKNEKEELLFQGIKSIFWKPLKFKEETFGVISFSSTSTFKKWTNEDEVIINIFSEISINTLNKIEFERKISESEKRFKKLVENSSDVTLIVSKDFKNLYVSPAVVNILGYSAQERLNQNPLDLVHPDDVQLVLSAVNSLEATNQKVTIQFRVKHKLGHYIWIEATITNLLDEPLINGYLVNYHDITEKREAYLKLQESEERYRLLAEESGDVLYKLNYSTMKYDYISPVIKELTGYTPEEINEIGFRNIIDEIYLFLHPDRNVQDIKDLRVKGLTGEYLADYKIRKKDGTLKWVRDHSFPVYNQEGKLYGSIGILTDITEIKKREEEIKKRELYLETLVDIQKSLIFLHDLREFYNFMLPKLGRLCDVSRCYVFENSRDESGKLLMSQIAEWCAEGITPQIDNPQLHNLPYDELGFDLMGILVNNGYWEAIVKNLAEPTKSILESQNIMSILLIPIMIQDEFFGYIGFDDCLKERTWSQMEIEILKSAAASISLAIESKRKQEEVIKAKDELIEANRLRAGFLSILSHEIRTPLNLIMGYNEVLQERFYNPDDSELQLYFNSIKNNSLRLLNTINQLIEISKLNAGMFSVQMKNLDLKKYIIEACNNMKIKADEKKLKLNCILPEEDLIVEADDYCLHGILENLIMNAIKYSKQGEIKISANAKQNWAEIKIKDEGEGISEEYLKHIYKPFSQEDVSYKRRYEGAGLGLAITKKYVELIGGDITIESKKGVGTTVYVKLRRIKN